MGLIIQVGEVSEMLKAPEHFPKCGNYVPPVGELPIRVKESDGFDSIISLTNNSNGQPHYSILTPGPPSTVTTTSTVRTSTDLDLDENQNQFSIFFVHFLFIFIHEKREECETYCLL